RAERTRLLLVTTATALAAVAVAAAGPITFVALAAPQLARRLTHTAAPGLIATALMGGLLVAASDLVAQRAFGDTQMPVGIVTGVVGGVSLGWLLAHEWRRGAA